MNVLNEMRVESVVEDKDKLTVTTTGAKYVFDKQSETGKISCYQLINKERLVATINFHFPFSSLTVENKNEHACILHQAFRGEFFARLQINSDSVLDIYTPLELNVGFNVHFAAEFKAKKDGNTLLIDKIGGVGIYPCRGFDKLTENNLSAEEYQLTYTMKRPARFLFSVFPPRKFQEDRYLQEGIAHIGVNVPFAVYPYPSDDMIEKAYECANLLTLHCQIWQGKNTGKGMTNKDDKEIIADAAFCNFRNVPLDEKELARVVKKCHSLKMKVIPYMSPTFSVAMGDDFLREMNRVIEKYGFDGIYFDGFTFDLLYGYQLIKDARKLLGDKILYLHATVEPFWDKYVCCPFVFTYADYVIRGELPGDFDEKFLRYAISGFNISNSIHYTCHCYYTPEFVSKIIDKAIEYKVKFYLGLPEQEADKVLREKYFPKFKKLQQ